MTKATEATGSYIDRSTILAASDLKTEDVTVPEWGGKVTVRSLNGKERDSYEASLVSGRGKDRDINLRNARAKLIVLSVIDHKSGERMFSDSDVSALGAKSAAAMQRVFDVAARLSGLSDDDLEELTEAFD